MMQRCRQVSLLTSLLAMTLPLATRGCLPEKGQEIPSYNMVETLFMAPAVLHVTNTANHQTGNWDSDFSVQCVFKCQDKDVPASVTLIGGNLRNSCQGTPDFVLGMPYILAVTPAAESGLFYLYEPAIKNTGAFAPTAENLQTASDICGMAPYNVTSGSRDPRQMAADCPSPTTDTTNCVQPLDGAASHFRITLRLIVICLSIFYGVKC